MHVSIEPRGSKSEVPVGRVGRRCPQCREDALVMDRRHVSPPRWGAPLVTEYYDCGFCDARYQYSPADDRWRALS